jgi:hypothetical protein
VAAIFIAIYPIGIIALFVALLCANRKVLGDQAGGAAHVGKWWAGDLETFHFLVDGYRRETFWYEIVDFIRCDPTHSVSVCISTQLTVYRCVTFWTS